MRKLERVYRRDKTDENHIAWRAVETTTLHASAEVRWLLVTCNKFEHWWPEGTLVNCCSSLLKHPITRLKTLLFISSLKWMEYVRLLLVLHPLRLLRTSTLGAPSTEIISRQCPSLALLQKETIDEIAKIASCTTKHCQLDPAPTSLVKRLLPLLVPTFANKGNATLKEGVFPVILKHAIVLPWLKKLTFNPEDLNSFRPISNLSVKDCWASCGREIQWVHQITPPSRQSAYRVNHSMKTTVIAVHHFIVRAIP